MSCVCFLFVCVLYFIGFLFYDCGNESGLSQNGGVDVIDRTNYIFASREGI